MKTRRDYLRALARAGATIVLVGPVVIAMIATLFLMILFMMALIAAFMVALALVTPLVVAR